MSNFNKDRVINYFETGKVTQKLNALTYTDRNFSNAYAKGQRNVPKEKQNFPVAEFVFKESLWNKLKIKPSWMADVESYGTTEATICVISSPEMVAHLINSKVNPKRIHFIADQKWKANFVEKELGIDKDSVSVLKSVTEYKGETLMAMLENKVTKGQYDLTIMNPPWALTDKFLEIAKTITKDNGQIGVIMQAEAVKHLDWSTVADYEYTHNNFDGVNLNSVVTVINKAGTDETLLTDLQGKKVSVDPAQITVAPTTNLSIWSKVNALVSTNYQGIDFTSGKLHRREFIEDSKGIDVVETVGRKNQPLNVKTLSSVLAGKVTGENDYMVVMGADYEPGDIGPLKHKPKGLSIPNRVHGIIVKNSKEAQLVIDYLQSDAVRQLVSVLKITSKNSKTVFSKIPHWNTSKAWMSKF